MEEQLETVKAGPEASLAAPVKRTDPRPYVGPEFEAKCNKIISQLSRDNSSSDLEEHFPSSCVEAIILP